LGRPHDSATPAFWLYSAENRAGARCRRRDSNARNADYDSARPTRRNRSVEPKRAEGVLGCAVLPQACPGTALAEARRAWPVLRASSVRTAMKASLMRSRRGEPRPRAKRGGDHEHIADAGLSAVRDRGSAMPLLDARQAGALLNVPRTWASTQAVLAFAPNSPHRPASCRASGSKHGYRGCQAVPAIRWCVQV
jgi:hypothetical protein